MADFSNSRLFLGYGGSGKTTALIHCIEDFAAHGFNPEKLLILCASPCRAEEFRTRLRQHFLDLARKTEENRWLFYALCCAGLPIVHPANYIFPDKAPECFVIDDFDRFPPSLQEILQDNLHRMYGNFCLATSPDCVPAVSGMIIQLSCAYRTDRSLQNILSPLLPSREGRSRENDAYTTEKFFRFIPMQNVTQRPAALTAELNRLKRRRDFEKTAQRLPRIAIVCQTDRQLNWVRTSLSEESLHQVGLPARYTSDGLLAGAFLRAVCQPNSPKALYALASLLHCTPDAMLLRHLHEEMPDLVLPTLISALNRPLKNWSALREEAVLDPVNALEMLAVSSDFLHLLSLPNPSPAELLCLLERLPYGSLAPRPEDILLCRADHPDLPAADYLLLPFITQSSDCSENLLRRVLSSAGCSLSFLTCGPGEANSWQNILERGLAHAADR